MPVDPGTKLKGMKIHAGEYLLNIIEMQEAVVVAGPVKDIYAETVKLVNLYFDSTCNKTQERIKFRQLKQRVDENFTDWFLRLEAQAKFCCFEEEQRKEEFLQALIGSSVHELAEKLYEASSFFNNDIGKMIQHGQHLDVVRMNKVDDPIAGKFKTESLLDDSTRPVMWVENRSSARSKNRTENRPYQRYQSSTGKGDVEYKPRNWIPNNKDCERCGRRHSFNRCPAYRSKCNKCDKIGHWESKCRSYPRGKPWEEDKKDGILKHVARVNKVDESE